MQEEDMWEEMKTFDLDGHMATYHEDGFLQVFEMNGRYSIDVYASSFDSSTYDIYVNGAEMLYVKDLTKGVEAAIKVWEAQQ